MIIEPILLGLSSGVWCITSCAPAVVPLIAAEERLSAVKFLALLLSGRFLAYILTGFILGVTGGYVRGYIDPNFERVLAACSWTVIGSVLIMSGISNYSKHSFCLKNRLKIGVVTPFITGIGTGLAICPPFVAASAKVFGSTTGVGGALYFALFFVGTSVYISALMLLKIPAKKFEKFRLVSRVTQIVLGGYFLLFSGLLTLIGS